MDKEKNEIFTTIFDKSQGDLHQTVGYDLKFLINKDNLKQ